MSKHIRNFERKYIPVLRTKHWYKILKVIILSPILLPIYYIGKAFNFIREFLLRILSAEKRQTASTKLDNIVSGWMNLMIDNAVVEEVALKRANICATCPFAEMSGGLYTIVVDNKTKQIRGLKCTQCGCPLSAKVRSADDYCPVGKW
jgi:hypothetical protein